MSLRALLGLVAAKVRSSRASPYVVFAIMVAALFHPVLRGWVLNGHHDHHDQIVPFYRAYARAFKADETPLWNPYIFCGKSAMGSGMFVYFYPLYWLVFSVPEEFIAHAATYVLLFHVGVALVASFAFFRALAEDCFWPTVAAVVYVFSSSMVLQMSTELNFATFAYLPVVLWLVERLDSGRHLPVVAGLAAAYGLMLVSGNVQMVTYAVAVALGYSVARSILEDGRWGLDLRRLGAAFAGFALGALASAVRWVPFYYAIKNEGGAPTSYAQFKAMSVTEPADLVRFFVPEIFGNDLYIRYYGRINHFESFACYAGLFAALVSIYSLVFVWNRKTAFWNVAFAVIVLVALGTPFTWLHYVATGRSLLHYSRIAWLLPLCCAALVAASGKQLFSRLDRRATVFLVALGAAIAASVLAVYHWKVPLIAKVVNHDELVDAFVQLGVFGILFLLAALLARRFGEGSPEFRFLYAAATCLDLFLIARIEGSVARPFLSPAADLTTPAIDARAASAVSAEGNEFRVFRQLELTAPKAFDQYTLNDRFITLGAFSSAGYDNGAPKRIARLYTYPTSVPRFFERILTPQNERVAQLTSTLLVVSEKGILQVNAPLPRVKLFTRFQVASDDEQAVQKVLDKDWDPQASVLLSSDPGIPSVDADARGRVKIVDEGVNHVEVRAQTETPAIVLLTDTWDTGWTLTVDGERAEPLRANYAFRAARVPAGDHRIKWTFEQAGYESGQRLSLLALALIAGLGLRAWWTAKRPDKHAIQRRDPKSESPAPTRP
jgi:hypothetical protein